MSAPEILLLVTGHWSLVTGQGQVMTNEQEIVGTDETPVVQPAVPPTHAQNPATSRYGRRRSEIGKDWKNYSYTEARRDYSRLNPAAQAAVQRGMERFTGDWGRAQKVFFADVMQCVMRALKCKHQCCAGKTPEERLEDAW